MQSTDFDVIKEIPGFKVILKTVLKTQIQLLVQQLADQTGEESVILTACLTDGTLSHLGSESGKVFLEGHEDIKSQFLGFCLKRYHSKAQSEEERRDPTCSDSCTISANATSARVASTGRRTRLKPSRLHTSVQHFPAHQRPNSSVKHGPHPVSLFQAVPQEADSNIIQDPYLRSSHAKKRAANQTDIVTLQTEKNTLQGPSKVIKIDTLDSKVEHGREARTENTDGEMVSDSWKHKEDDNDHQKTMPTGSADVKENEFQEINPDDLESASGLSSTLSSLTSAASDDTTAENIKLNPISVTQSSGSDSQAKTITSDIDLDVSVKVEDITESELELEITGVEPGQMTRVDDSWMNVSDMEFMSSVSRLTTQGDTSQGDTSENQHEPVYNDHDWRQSKIVSGKYKVSCSMCEKSFRSKWYLERHMLIHTGEKPFSCQYCGRRFNLKHNMKAHMIVHMQKQNF